MTAMMAAVTMMMIIIVVIVIIMVMVVVIINSGRIRALSPRVWRSFICGATGQHQGKHQNK
jgi:hypothetical protein